MKSYESINEADEDEDERSESAANDSGRVDFELPLIDEQEQD